MCGAVSVVAGRSALKQITSEASQERFDERRVNMLKLQLIQFQRQVPLCSLFGCCHLCVCHECVCECVCECLCVCVGVHVHVSLSFQ